MMDYDVEFEKLRVFKYKQNEQKKRGLNNYNILTAVLKEHDEVRLHSNMLFSFLNPHGEHFQGTLFLEEFLDVIGIKSLAFEINAQNCFVRKEYQNIDLYITDNDKHIIIENKIYAGDQEHQIARYLKSIQDEDPNASEMDILVIYLTLDGKTPSQVSLNELTIKHGYLESSSKKQAIYKSISYQKEVIDWINSCQYEVQNITNLNSALDDYKNVIDRLNNNYKEKIMSLTEYIRKDRSIYELAVELESNLLTAQKLIADSFFKELRIELEKELGDEWNVEDHGSSQPNYPIKIDKKKWLEQKNYFSIIFAKEGGNIFIGISPLVPSELDIQHDIVEKYTQIISKIPLMVNPSQAWLCQESIETLVNYQHDFYHYILTNKNAVQIITSQMMRMIRAFEIDSNFISTINDRYSLK